MGCAVVIIRGEVSQARLLQRHRLVAPLFGRRQAVETRIGCDRTIIDLPADDLKVLIKAFEQFLRAQMSEPWASSRSVLRYLRCGAEAHFRGECVDGAESKWSVRLSMSGCAGQCQVTAQVAAHWAEIWVHRQGSAITRDILGSCGFKPTHVEGLAGSQVFLPIGEAGYASFVREGYSGASGGKRAHFSIDAAVIESNRASARQILTTLEEQFLPLMLTGTCYCQLCYPTFNSSVVVGPTLGLR